MCRCINESQIKELMDFVNLRKVAAKEILSLDEAALYMNVSKSYLYKLTSAREITFYKPGAKLIFFKRVDLDEWMLRTKIPSNSELITLRSRKRSSSLTEQVMS